MSSLTHTIAVNNLNYLNQYWNDDGIKGLKNTRVDEKGRLRRTHCCYKLFCQRRCQEQINQTVVNSLKKLTVTSLNETTESTRATLSTLSKRIDILNKAGDYLNVNNLLSDEIFSLLMEKRQKIINKHKYQVIIDNRNK